MRFMDVYLSQTQAELKAKMKEYGITKPVKDQVKEIAALGGNGSYYVADYFFLSLFVHSVFTELQPPSPKFTPGYAIRCAAYIAMNTLAVYHEHSKPVMKGQIEDEQQMFFAGIQELEDTGVYGAYDYPPYQDEDEPETSD